MMNSNVKLNVNIVKDVEKLTLRSSNKQVLLVHE